MDEDNQTRAEKLAEDIADAIHTGTFAPGFRLDEQALADRYGVSRTPVREALRRLAASGLIEIRPRRGAQVAQVTPEQLEGLFVAMGEMEATCARLAAMSMTPVERRRLRALHEKMEGMAARSEAEAYAEANQALHALIYAGAHNAPLADFTAGLRRRLGRFRNAQFRIAGRLARSHAEHDLVVKAIVAGEPMAAHAAMLDHVSLVENAFEQFSAGQMPAPTAA
jgi:DNA-binding GntR family transcriptional regulator